MSWMHCSPTQARNLPSMPCAHRTASLSALTRAAPGSELTRFLRASTSARWGNVLGRAGPGRESTAARLFEGKDGLADWAVSIPRSAGIGVRAGVASSLARCTG
eukprot:8744292-Pyramimonas_sp.AAC.1